MVTVEQHTVKARLWRAARVESCRTCNVWPCFKHLSEYVAASVEAFAEQDQHAAHTWFPELVDALD